MAHSKSALKRWRQNEAHRARNKSVRSATRSAVKKAHTAITAGDSEAQAAIREAASILDRAAKTHVVHKNAVARHKSRMMRQLNAASAAPAAVEATAPSRTRKASGTKTAPKTTRAKTAAKPRTTKAKS
ncbi:MAG TPA: 30S ribosomal protein S20 [Dehalococcoidia bacterium]|nr:30S ribosomal protein S20 [Dehalococcoidia bacterium]